MKKVLRGKCFAYVEEMKQKMAEALKDFKIDKFKTFLSNGKNVSIGELHQMENSLKMTEMETCKNKFTVFL